MIEHLKLQHYQNMPWKNGLGLTFEIARGPHHDTDDFDWRISMAEVEQDSEFSLFQGKQRIISVLSGAGMNLSLASTATDQGQTVQVLPRTLFAFDGELRVCCGLPDGPIRDLNLIYRKARVHPRMQWILASSPQTVLSSAREIFIFNMAPGATIEIAKHSYDLDTLDCLKILNPEQMLTIQLPGNGPKDCCLIELF
jgi:hypothetical protein